VRLRETLGVRCDWSIYEFRPEGRILVARRRNLMTNHGLTAFAGAIQGSYAAAGYSPPAYLVIETFAPTITNVGGIGVAATSVTLNGAAHLAGDTQLVLDVGGANQETVSFSAVSVSSGSYTYTISATTKTHAQNVPCSRAIAQSDAMSSVQGELQFDSVNFPNQRMQTNGGYSGGTGNWVTSFFFSGTQAIGTWARLGLADSLTVGQGNLHNHLVQGFTQASGYDVEVDVSVTLSNV
jgi:hypothetical protein